MPRDRRLYMTFPIDFDEHPKVSPLSDAAFRAFVEMNAYSRRQDLNGRIPVQVAKKRWKSRALTELVESHPERPLVVLDGADYVIRDYAQHQFTSADLEELRSKRAAAGAKGGAAKAAARAEQTVSKPLASAIAKGQQNVAGFRVQGVNQDLTRNPPNRNAPAEDDLLGQLDPVIASVVSATAELGLKVHPLCASSVVEFIDGRRGRNASPVKVPTRYYPDTIRRSWPEVEKFIHEQGLAS